MVRDGGHSGRSKGTDRQTHSNETEAETVTEDDRECGGKKRGESGGVTGAQRCPRVTDEQPAVVGKPWISGRAWNGGVERFPRVTDEPVVGKP